MQVSFIDTLKIQVAPTVQRDSNPNLCDAGTMLYQLIYDATQLGAGQRVGFVCSRERTG